MSLKQSFGIDSDMEVDAFSKRSEYVPEIDKNYKFDKDKTRLLNVKPEIIASVVSLSNL